LGKNDPMPSATVTGVDGKRIGLTSLTGNVVLLNFWATWCGACVEELPSLDRLGRRLAAEPGIRLLAVSLDEGLSPASLGSSWKKAGLTLPVALDETGRVGALFGIQVLPTTFVIDKVGRVQYVVVGARKWDDDQWVKGLVAFRDGKVP